MRIAAQLLSRVETTAVEAISYGAAQSVRLPSTPQPYRLLADRSPTSGADTWRR